MENVACIGDIDEHGELVHELPREEALVRLYELVCRYSAGSRQFCPVALERGDTRPHRFAFGCCRDAARLVAA